MEQALPGYPGVVVGRNFHLTDLDYADDIAVLGESYKDIQMVLNRIQEKAAAIGMRINASKTKILSAGIPQAERSSVTLNGETLEETDSFKYLGCTFIGTGQGMNEIETRINAARAAFCRLQRRLWSRPEIRLRTKIRIYQALVRSILLYGCETWPIRKADLRRVEVFDHYNLRRILHVRPLDFVANKEVRRRCNLQAITDLLRARRLRWFGHASRCDAGVFIHEAISPRPLPGWKKRVGGQLRTWLGTIKADAELISGPLIYGLSRWRRDWLLLTRDLASDRRAWAAAIRDVHLHEADSTPPG